jgi:hypothetical protein
MIAHAVTILVIATVGALLYFGFWAELVVGLFALGVYSVVHMIVDTVIDAHFG